jgi:hypothetical protein
MFAAKKSIIMLATIGCMMTSAFAQNPDTNEQFVVNAVEKTTSAFIDSLNISGDTIYIEDQTGLAGLIVDGFRLALLKNKNSVVASIDRAGAIAVRANLSLSAFEFKYTEGRSRGFLKKPFIKRQLTGQLLINLAASDFNYIGFRDFSASDEVEPAYANYIASMRYNQLSPDNPGGGLIKYLEPLAVTATVGGLIYLFFINR